MFHGTDRTTQDGSLLIVALGVMFYSGVFYLLFLVFFQSERLSLTSYCEVGLDIIYN